MGVHRPTQRVRVRRRRHWRRRGWRWPRGTRDALVVVVVSAVAYVMLTRIVLPLVS